jgi:hypothetical protein
MYNIWIPSSRPTLAKETKKCFLPYNTVIFDGSGYESFSKLVNHCIVKSTEEIVIIISDKARGTFSDIDKMLKLIHKGYGWVGLYRFGFFGFKKDLIRKIGFMDERFVGSGWEDSDYIRRMKESNIGFYYMEEIPFLKMRTSWKYCKPNSDELDLNSPARKHYMNKWEDRVNPFSITRRLEEEIYSYDIGESKNSNFLDFTHTKILERDGKFIYDAVMYKNIRK